MSKVQLSGNASGTGIFTIASPNSNTDRTLTLPQATGTLISTADSGTVSQTMLAAGVAGNGPAFSYSKTASQLVTNSTWTKVTWNLLQFDTNSNFDTVNNRFRPTVAGYYQVNYTIDTGVPTISVSSSGLYKNGTILYQGTMFGSGSNGEFISASSNLVYLNGSTDYVEVYAYITSNSTPYVYSGAGSTFQAFLARSA